MKLFVIGATSRTGRKVVEQALARSHQVTAFVRSPEGIKLKNERLTLLVALYWNHHSILNMMSILLSVAAPCDFERRSRNFVRSNW
jgi:putative NADH-flavin reductase